MKLFLISQSENTDYDTYDSAVVAAPDEETARNTHPCHGMPVNWVNPGIIWCSSVEHVRVQYLGEAADDIKQGVVCASFNAG